MMNNTSSPARPDRHNPGNPVALAATRAGLPGQDRARRQALLHKFSLAMLLAALVFSYLLAAAPAQAGSLGFTAASIQPQQEDDC
jgi:hypothetical protein